MASEISQFFMSLKYMAIIMMIKFNRAIDLQLQMAQMAVL